MKGIQAALADLEMWGQTRRLITHSRRLDYSSNDYLGLSENAVIREKLIQALRSGCPLGSTGSRLLSGNSPFHESTEAFLAEVFNAESALLFSSGFMANLGVTTAIGDEDTEFFSDELNHASLIDGMRLSKAKKSVFRHSDPSHLRELLAASASRRKVIVTETVFSMDGDLADLEELTRLAREFDAWLIVDEAHSTGLFGGRGLGAIDGLDTDGVNLVSILTGGKALGAEGAFVLAPQAFKDLLINRARSFIFSTALSPLAAIHLKASVEWTLENPEVGRTVLRNAEALRSKLQHHSRLTPSRSQITGVILGSNSKALRVSSALADRGITVRAIRAPTVAPGSERLRISVTAKHTPQEIDHLARALKEELQLHE